MIQHLLRETALNAAWLTAHALAGLILYVLAGA